MKDGLCVALAMYLVVETAGGALTAQGQPLPPTNLTTQVVGNRVTVSWVARPGSSATEFLISVGTQPGASNVFVGSVGTRTTVSGDVENGTYYWRVAAVTPFGTSAPSSDEVFTVPSGCAPPGAPQNFAAEVNGTRVSLSWSPPAGTGVLTTYLVEAGSVSGAANLFNAPTGSVQPALSVEAPEGTYFVRIRAQNGCGTSAPSNELVIRVVPDVRPCQYTVSPRSTEFSSAGGVLDVRIDTTANCRWDITADSWIVPEGQLNGVGPSIVRFRVSSNTIAYRDGSVSIRGNDGRPQASVRITQPVQPPPPCVYTVTPRSVQLDAASTPFEISIQSSQGCPWLVSSSAPWLRLGRDSGIGSSRVSVTAGANSATLRDAVLTFAFAGESVDVPVSQQPGAAPLVADFRPTDVCASTIVSTSAVRLCTFDASLSSPLEAITGYSWTIGGLQFSSPGPLLGDVVLPAPGGAFEREVTLTVRDRANRVNSRTRTIAFVAPPSPGPAPPCLSLVPEPRSQMASSVGGAFELRVTTPCADSTWVPYVVGAASAWITVTSPASFSGNALVQYAVSQNTSGLTRSGQIVFVGPSGALVSFTVTQAP